MANNKEIPEAKSLRWVCNQIPDNLGDSNEERMLKAIKEYCKRGADKIEELAKDKIIKSEQIYGIAKLPRDNKYYECVCTRCGENLKYKISNYCMYCGAKLDTQRRKKADKYSEILQLKNYCEKIGLKCELTRVQDGYKIKFQLGDCIQHCSSYLGKYGYIEFGDCHCEDIKEYEPYTLTKAKSIVKKHKDWLNIREEDEQC